MWLIPEVAVPLCRVSGKPMHLAPSGRWVCRLEPVVIHGVCWNALNPGSA